jgi:hypothetical protein
MTNNKSHTRAPFGFGGHLVIASLCCGFFCSIGSSEIIEFTFEGVIEDAGGAVAPPVSVGDAFVYRFWFDSGAIDSDPAPNFGLYAESLDLRDLAIGTWVGAANGLGEISVLDNGFAGDSYSANIVDPLLFASVGMTNFGGGAFDSDALPLDLNLSQWDIRQFSVEILVGPAFWEASGQITSFSRRVVPSPAGVFLGAGGVLAGCRRRRFGR